MVHVLVLEYDTSTGIGIELARCNRWHRYFGAPLVVHGFSNLDNHKTRVAASNRNNRKLLLWGIFKLQEVCLVAKKINSKKVT